MFLTVRLRFALDSITSFCLLYYFVFPLVNLLAMSFGVGPDRIKLRFFFFFLNHRSLFTFLSRGNFTTIPSPPASTSEVLPPPRAT